MGGNVQRQCERAGEREHVAQRVGVGQRPRGAKVAAEVKEVVLGDRLVDFGGVEIQVGVARILIDRDGGLQRRRQDEHRQQELQPTGLAGDLHGEPPGHERGHQPGEVMRLFAADHERGHQQRDHDGNDARARRAAPAALTRSEQCDERGECEQPCHRRDLQPLEGHVEIPRGGDDRRPDKHAQRVARQADEAQQQGAHHRHHVLQRRRLVKDVRGHQSCGGQQGKRREADGRRCPHAQRGRQTRRHHVRRGAQLSASRDADRRIPITYTKRPSSSSATMKAIPA